MEGFFISSHQPIIFLKYGFEILLDWVMYYTVKWYIITVTLSYDFLLIQESSIIYLIIKKFG